MSSLAPHRLRGHQLHPNEKPGWTSRRLDSMIFKVSSNL